MILAGDIATLGGKVPSWACRAKNFGESTPIGQFGAGVSQLSNQLKAMQLELAADVLKRLFKLVDGLGQNLLSGGSDPVPKAGEE